MIRAILIFLALTGAIMVSITTVRHMTGEQLWSATKTFFVSAISALIALIIMVGIVIIF